MIYRDKEGELLVECNECGTEQFAGTLEFQSFIRSIKSDGWKIRLVGQGDWQHICPECAAA